MKMKPEHYEALKILYKRVPPLLEHGITKLTDVYMRGDADKSIASNDINMRLRWDLFHCIEQDTKRRMMDDMYEYLNDNHIDTALKHIMVELLDEAAFNASGDGADTPMESIDVEITSIKVNI